MTPYRTYQSWEYGETPVPVSTNVAVGLILENLDNGFHFSGKQIVDIFKSSGMKI